MMIKYVVDSIGIQRHSAREMTEPAQEDVWDPGLKNCQVRMIMFNQAYLTEQQQNGDARVPGPIVYQGKQLKRP